jgi:transcriptional regulator with XRE-family HTH domain
LATVAGFGGSYSVNRIEQGQTTRLSVEAITRLATALAVTPQYLLGLQPAAAPSLEDQAFYQQYLAQPPQLRATIRRIVAILVKDPPNAG